MRYGALLRVSKNASMVLLGTVIRMALTFIFVIYVARAFGVDFYGKFALTLNLFEMFLSLSATGLCILVTRETAKDHTWLSRNLGSALLIVSLLGVGAAVVLGFWSQLRLSTRPILAWPCVLPPPRFYRRQSARWQRQFS